ncbi:MAG: (2Fe-2S)-binding protein [Chloroflexi bacterium]|nr:(2Fe-2S)-binding protein [Chloroflexota bacterium]
MTHVFHSDTPPANAGGDGERFTIEVNGEAVAACEGQTVAAALIATGHRMFGHTPSGAPRGIFCGMGVCFDCLVTVDGLADQRACVTPVRPGMQVQTTPAREWYDGRD